MNRESSSLSPPTSDKAYMFAGYLPCGECRGFAPRLPLQVNLGNDT